MSDLSYTLHHGDCLEVLKTMADNSVDSVVSDPPAGIAFMNKAWDEDKGGRDNWIEWMTEVMVEVGRVLKPGGHILMWALPRTSHWTATAIENAKFEIRDIIHHIFGCLSEDTEILTDNGWQRYDTLFVGSMVMCYNIDNKTFELMPTEEVIVYDYKDTAYHIKSDTTDQIVSKEHRCIVERGGREVFRYAETLQQQETIPVLEIMQELQEPISCDDERAGYEKHLLQSKMFRGSVKEAENREENWREGKASNAKVCRVRKGNKAKTKDVESYKDTCLQLSLQRNSSGRGMEETRAQRTLELDKKERTRFSRKNDGEHKPILERGRDISQSQGELPELQHKVCEMPERIYRNGTQGWICDGASTDSSKGNQKVIKEVRSRASHRPQSRKQYFEQSYVIQNESGTQEIRGWEYEHKTTLATITPINYKGKMWCVRVPTGAFVARRNGRIFVTGNSGFPKSLDISKSIDKQAGVEREVVGVSKKQPAGFIRNGRTDEEIFSVVDKTKKPETITAPATEEAKQWDGWGTALKPACEHWILARKPLSAKTIAANVLEYGTGGLNIDGCRVKGEPWKAHRATGLAKNKFFTDGDATIIEKKPHTQ